ncbi:hypothetical protein [Stratiformator vulcanicus]|uniref:Uncharacterized protein n=1 Tax=Stratiformator vulcanicus TaxID=2527980 RepID=A0A517R6G0_9PLAN|nr:hypothetical protein [Stratiformator vulcanicus]QDT39484.1 hypothetical protein Pan189_38920 [Stratiformator vulcanicus]
MNPSEPHLIRLHGPWEVTAGLDNSPQRVRLPDSIEVPQNANVAVSSLHFSRAFGLPTNIDAKSVRLIVEEIGGPGTLDLNGEWLANADAGDDIAIDVTPMLRSRNRMTLRIQIEGCQSITPFRAVRLEIT